MVAKHAPYITVLSYLIEVIQKHDLEQIVNQPIHNWNILDLFLLKQPNHKCTVNSLPDSSDHQVICDQVWENWSYPHILHFEKYEFEILNALFFSCGTIQSRQIYYIYK